MKILHEDAALIAVDKPAGIAAIPERDPGQPSLLAEVTAHCGGKIYIVHRLDKPVSGVIVYAKTAAAHRCLNLQFERRTVRKTYLAWVWGRLATDSGTIDQPLRQFGSGRMGIDPRRGKPSVTRFRVRERTAVHTLLEVQPETGRRHQIRVHLYSIGYPIVGDRLYGDKSKGFPRLLLHAWCLQFQHPDGQGVSLEAELAEGSGFFPD